jgi:hypothetical protein
MATSELLVKYSMLDAVQQNALIDYLNALLSENKKREKKRFNYLEYRKRIFSLSEWSDEDVALIESARYTGNWNIHTW